MIQLSAGRLTADWLVECMNPDMIPYGMSLDVSLSQKKKQKKKRHNKNQILIRLGFILLNNFER
jgi:hypothetical protein